MIPVTSKNIQKTLILASKGGSAAAAINGTFFRIQSFSLAVFILKNLNFFLVKRKKCHQQICGCRGKNGLRRQSSSAILRGPGALFFGTRLSVAPQNRLILRAFSKVQEGLRILVHPLSH